jgi:hypothetical protein
MKMTVAWDAAPGILTELTDVSEVLTASITGEMIKVVSTSETSVNL